jgi:hypothetical protein
MVCCKYHGTRQLHVMPYGELGTLKTTVLSLVSPVMYVLMLNARLIVSCATRWDVYFQPSR